VKKVTRCSSCVLFGFIRDEKKDEKIDLIERRRLVRFGKKVYTKFRGNFLRHHGGGTLMHQPNMLLLCSLLYKIDMDASTILLQ